MLITQESKRLADAEMEAPPSCLWRGADQQTRNGIELVADVESKRTDRRLITESRADRITEIAELECERIGPDVAGIEKHDGAPIAAQRAAKLFAHQEHAVAAQRQSRSAERTHLVPSPSANRRRAAEEVPLRKRRVARNQTRRPKIDEHQAAGQDDLLADWQVLPAINRHCVVVERARHEASRLFRVKRDLVAAMRVQQVVRRGMLEVETHRVQRPPLLAGSGIEAERDEIGAQLQIRF